MTKKQYSISNILLLLIGVILVIELIRDSTHTGDFIGYVNAGNAVLNHQNIYADYLNTWPPFFSIFSVVLAIGDGMSSYFVRFLWLLGSIVAMYYIVNQSVKLIFKKQLSLRPKDNSIIIQDPLVLVPLLIMLRYIMDNLANIQINIFMLLCALLSIIFFIKKKYVWVGLLLGLTISLKVYTIFFLFYFLFKREFKPVLWTLFFVLLFNAISILVFGYDQALEYYQQWVSEVAPRSYLAQHKNQSVFGAFLRFFTSSEIGFNLHVNFLEVKASTIKMATYAAVALASIFPAFLFRKKLKETGSINAILEYSLIFTAIPLLSPVAWKAYFIFLWVPYFLLYAMLFRANTQLDKRTLNVLKYLFWLSVVLIVGSTELFVGNYFSDVLEAYSVITFGTILLLLMQIFIFMRIEKFDLKSISFRTAPGKD